MQIKELQTWEIMVPYRSNKGKNYSVPYHQEWDAKVMAISGGMTIFRVAQGKWQHGKLYKEPMIPVRISCTEDQIKEIMSITMEHYDQLAVHASCVSEKTFIMTREERNKNE